MGLKSRLGLLTVVVVCTAAYIFQTPLRLSFLFAAGRNKGCPFFEAVRSAANGRRQLELNSRILAASRLVGKDPAGFHLWDTPSGRYWIPEGSDYTLPFNLAEQERKIYGTGDRAVHKGDVVLDCGANVGVYVHTALEAGASLVVAIEPAPENIECLRRNYPAELRAGRVIIYPKGVWDKDETLTMNIDPGNSAADSFVMRPEHSHPGPQLTLTTIDKIVEELKLERVDFIKMDIEGAERRALAGARQTIARWHPHMALAAYHRPDDPETIPAAALAGWPGYRMECGPCADAQTFVRPDVLYFR
jgi:FkbM family methyltransferase